MSTTLGETSRAHTMPPIQVTRFWGGEKRGGCVQLAAGVVGAEHKTVLMSMSKQQAKELIELLQQAVDI